MSTDLQVAGDIAAPAVEARTVGAPGWLAARRRAAWAAFEALPMPASNRDEDWRRTDISGLDLRRFRSTPESGADPTALIDLMRALRDRSVPEAAFLGNARSGVVALDGADMLTAQGVVVSSLEEAAWQHPEIVQRALASAAVDDSKFLALWNALWRGGAFVYVPTGVEARCPVWLAHGTGAADAAVFPATVVVLEAESALTVIEAFASPAEGDRAVLSDAAALLHVGDGARLDYCLLQQWGPQTWHIATHRAVLGRDARLRLFGATLGARLQKAYWDAVLEGRGADAQLTGLCFGDEHQHLDHQSLQRHVGEDTHSDLLLKVAVRDQAVSVYSGLIDVERSAQRTDGYVQNRNLLLSPSAKADSVPRLEIRANDVRCSHGTTAGHIDDDQRFYLMARGVPAAEADRLIVRGFMQDALDRCPQAGFAGLVGELLDEEIEGRSQAGLRGENLAS